MSGVLTGGGWGIWQAVNAGVTAAKRKRRIAVVTAPSGQRLTVRGAHVEKAHFIPPGDYTLALTCQADSERPDADDDLLFLDTLNISAGSGETVEADFDD